MPEKLSDTLTYVLSLALAATVIVFAAYKVIKLNGMEDPPANMGLNFPAAKRKVIIDPPVPAADPIVTQTVTPVLITPAHRQTPESPGVPLGKVRSYQLLAVVDGVAFVEMEVLRGKTLIPITVGAVLPGGLRIEKIEQRNGRWVLVAGPLKLEEAEIFAQ
jgi:hypothetical protein